MRQPALWQQTQRCVVTTDNSPYDRTLDGLDPAYVIDNLKQQISRANLDPLSKKKQLKAITHDKHRQNMRVILPAIAT